ncbi:unnamed protein product [marine sediment metagenome]|uniref:Uncharacterized protein n=1 Tax=marine sediment metagenome TaxID=412755 RepID=X1BMG9_9ZZZZ
MSFYFISFAIYYLSKNKALDLLFSSYLQTDENYFRLPPPSDNFWKEVVINKKFCPVKKDVQDADFILENGVLRRGEMPW